MNCYYPANHTLIKIPTEPKVKIAIGADIIQRMNHIYAESESLPYRANSNMHISNCLIRVVPLSGSQEDEKEEIEIVKDSLLTPFDSEEPYDRV